jgi:hypothetical protein
VIRLPDKTFVPGSLPAKNRVKTKVSETPIAREYINSKAWDQGLAPRLVAPSGSGKTSAGIDLLLEVNFASPTEIIYWTEYDYLSDLRNLWRMEDMTQKYARDDALWKEYLDWERSLWDLKECKFLFLDDVGRCYSPMQFYEVENLLRFREAKGLPTLVACQTGLWENLPSGMRSLIERNTIELQVR